MSQPPASPNLSDELRNAETELEAQSEDTTLLAQAMTALEEIERADDEARIASQSD